MKDENVFNRDKAINQSINVRCLYLHKLNEEKLDDKSSMIQSKCNKWEVFPQRICSKFTVEYACAIEISIHL